MIKCDVRGCKYNDGAGRCTKDDIFVSEADTGTPVCQDEDVEDDADPLGYTE